MLDNASNDSESPKDIHSFIRRLQKRKPDTDKVDHSPEEKRIKLEQHEQRNAKNFCNEKNKSKDSFNERSKVYQSKITTHYRTVKENLPKQISTKKKRNWDSFSSDEEYWISRYALKCNKSTGDIPVSRKTEKSDKHHSSLPITREEVKTGASVLSTAVCSGSSAKKDRCQVLKKVTKGNRKPSYQVKSESRNIDLNPSIGHKSQVNGNIINFQRNIEGKDFLREVDTSNKKETTQTSIGNARPEKNIFDIIENMKKRKSTIQLCDKNSIEDKQKAKEILDKLFKEEKDKNKTNSFVKDVSQHSDTAFNTFKKVEGAFLEKCVLREEQNQQSDQKTVNKLTEHNMLDHHLVIEKTLSKRQNSSKCDVEHEQLQSLLEKLSSRRQLEVGSPCKNGAVCAKVRNENKTELDNNNELPEPVILKPLDRRSNIKMFIGCLENNQDNKVNRDDAQYINKLFGNSEKLTPTTKAITNKCKGNVLNDIPCYATCKKVIQEKRNRGTNKKVPSQDEGSGNHNFSNTTRNNKSNKNTKSDTSISNSYIKGNEEIHRLITKLEGQTEGTEQGREEMHKLLMKLKSQTEETDSIKETSKYKETLLENNKKFNDNEKNVAGTASTSAEKQLQNSDVVKQCGVLSQIFNSGGTSELACNPCKGKIDKRESSWQKKQNRSKTVPGQQLTLLQIFSRCCSGNEQDNCGNRNIDENAKYNQKQDIVKQDFSLMCNKSKYEASLDQHSKISQKMDCNCNISSESKQKGDVIEKNNSNSAKSDGSSSHQTTNIRTFEDNRLLKKREEVGQCYSKHVEKIKTIHSLDHITQFTRHVANRQQTKIIQKVTASQPEFGKSTLKIDKLSESSQKGESVVENCNENITSTVQNLIKENSRKNREKSNYISTITCDAKIGKDGIHSIIRRMARTIEIDELNADHSRINQSYPSSSVLQSNQVRKEKTTKQSINANFEDTIIGDSVSNLVSNFQNSCLENDNNHSLVHCFENRSKMGHAQSSDEKKKIARILQNDDYTKISPTYTSVSIQADPQEECSDRSFNNILKVLKENSSDIDENKNGQKEKEDLIMNLMSKLKNIPPGKEIKSVRVYSRIQANDAVFKCLTDQDKKVKSVQVSQTDTPAKSKATSLNKFSHQGCIIDSTFRRTPNKVEQKDSRENNGNKNAEKNVAHSKNFMKSHGVASLDVRQKNAMVEQDLSSKDVIAPSGKTSSEVTFDRKFLGRTKPHDSLEKLKRVQLTKHSEEGKEMKMGNPYTNLLDDLETAVEKTDANKTSSIEFWKQTKKLDKENLEVQNVSPTNVDNNTIDTVFTDDQLKSVDKILFELSCRKSDKLTDCSYRSLSISKANVNISEDVKVQRTNLESKSEVQSAPHSRKIYEKSYSNDYIRTTESQCSVDQTVSRNLLLETKFDEHDEDEVQSVANNTDLQTVKNMLHEKSQHDSKSQPDITDFKNTFISSSHSVPNCEINAEAESFVDLYKTDTQNSKLPCSHPCNSSEECISEELWIPNSVFLKQTPQPSECVLGDQKDENNTMASCDQPESQFKNPIRTSCIHKKSEKLSIDENNNLMANYDVSNHSFFEPETHFEDPIQTNCIHGRNKEFPIGRKTTNDENMNDIKNYDMSNTSLLTAESQYDQIRTTCTLDKNKQNIIKKDTRPKSSQIISKKANELLADELVNTILTNNYEQCMRSKENNSSQTRDDVIGKLLKKTEGQKQKVKGAVKKYKKGKIKIYRLKKMKKLNKDMEKEEENLDFDDVFKKLTQDYQASARCSSPSETFVSTPSSYVSVNTLRSETLSTGSKELGSFQRSLREGFNNISKDKSLLHSDDSSENVNALDRDEIKMKIQDIFLKIFNDLTNGRRAALKFRRQCYENCILKDGRLQLKPEGEALESVLSSTVTRSQMNFKLVICIMKKIQVLLETNSKLTKRELYYQLKDMINGQGVVDRAINSVSCLLNVGMWALNIIAQKGLIFGNLKIMLSSGETINCNVPGTLIPQDINDIVEVHSDAYFILVIEKEAIFQKLLEEDIPNKLTRPFIMITGKGFPDLNTQLFLRKLWIIMRIPVFILVDADPHGIKIMLNYRFGSVANAHVSHHLAVPKARWLGLLPSEMTKFNVKKQAMTTNEQKMVEKLLNTPYMKDNPRIVEELKILQQNNLKAGIEGLIKTDVFLSQVYLPHKFLHRNFI